MLRSLALLLVIPVLSNAADKHQSQDWLYEVDNDGTGMLLASTENSVGQSLAQICVVRSGKCVYAVDFQIKCEDEAKYPALVNTDEGAQAIDFECTKIGALHMLVASNFNDIDNLVRAGRRIGFVIPMEDDQFKAVRFSLLGALHALDETRAATARHSTSAKGGNGGSTKTTKSRDSEVF